MNEYLKFDILEGKLLTDEVPKKFHALHRVINKELLLYSDVYEFRKMIIKLLHEDLLPPKEIASRLHIEYSDFGMFIKKCLGVHLMDVAKSVKNYNKRVGRSSTDSKSQYYKDCNFTFNVYDYPTIPGYEKLLELGFYSHKNKNGVCRDHMISKEYGWINNIPAEIISHVANCEILTNTANSKKSNGCSISIEELYRRINDNDFSVKERSSTLSFKSDNHRKNISKTNSKYKNVTNGIVNIRMLKEDDIPDGFWRGMTRNNKKLVRRPGLEPGCFRGTF